MKASRTRFSHLQFNLLWVCICEIPETVRAGSFSHRCQDFHVASHRSQLLHQFQHQVCQTGLTIWMWYISCPPEVKINHTARLPRSPHSPLFHDIFLHWVSLNIWLPFVRILVLQMVIPPQLNNTGTVRRETKLFQLCILMCYLKWWHLFSSGSITL